MKLEDMIAECMNTWGEWHSWVYGFLLMFMPWCWIKLDSCFVPTSYPESARNDIYADYHYYLFGIVCAFVIILTIVWLYIQFH